MQSVQLGKSMTAYNTQVYKYNELESRMSSTFQPNLTNTYYKSPISRTYDPKIFAPQAVYVPKVYTPKTVTKRKRSVSPKRVRSPSPKRGMDRKQRFQRDVAEKITLATLDQSAFQRDNIEWELLRKEVQSVENDLARLQNSLSKGGLNDVETMILGIQIEKYEKFIADNKDAVSDEAFQAAKEKIAKAQAAYSDIEIEIRVKQEQYFGTSKNVSQQSDVETMRESIRRQQNLQEEIALLIARRTQAFQAIKIAENEFGKLNSRNQRADYLLKLSELNRDMNRTIVEALKSIPPSGPADSEKQTQLRSAIEFYTNAQLNGVKTADSRYLKLAFEKTQERKTETLEEVKQLKTIIQEQALKIEEQKALANQLKEKLVYTGETAAMKKIENLKRDRDAKEQVYRKIAEELRIAKEQGVENNDLIQQLKNEKQAALKKATDVAEEVKKFKESQAKELSVLKAITTADKLEELKKSNAELGNDVANIVQTLTESLKKEHQAEIERLKKESQDFAVKNNQQTADLKKTLDDVKAENVSRTAMLSESVELKTKENQKLIETVEQLKKTNESNLMSEKEKNKAAVKKAQDEKDAVYLKQIQELREELRLAGEKEIENIKKANALALTQEKEKLEKQYQSDLLEAVKKAQDEKDAEKLEMIAAKNELQTKLDLEIQKVVNLGLTQQTEIENLKISQKKAINELILENQNALNQNKMAIEKLESEKQSALDTIKAQNKLELDKLTLEKQEALNQVNNINTQNKLDLDKLASEKQEALNQVNTINAQNKIDVELLKKAHEEELKKGVDKIEILNKENISLVQQIELTKTENETALLALKTQQAKDLELINGQHKVELEKIKSETNKEATNLLQTTNEQYKFEKSILEAQLKEKEDLINSQKTQFEELEKERIKQYEKKVEDAVKEKLQIKTLEIETLEKQKFEKLKAELEEDIETKKKFLDGDILSAVEKETEELKIQFSNDLNKAIEAEKAIMIEQLKKETTQEIAKLEEKQKAELLEKDNLIAEEKRNFNNLEVRMTMLNEKTKKTEQENRGFETVQEEQKKKQDALTEELKRVKSEFSALEKKTKNYDDLIATNELLTETETRNKKTIDNLTQNVLKLENEKATLTVDEKNRTELIQDLETQTKTKDLKILELEKSLSATQKEVQEKVLFLEKAKEFLENYQNETKTTYDELLKIEKEKLQTKLDVELEKSNKFEEVLKAQKLSITKLEAQLQTEQENVKTEQEKLNQLIVAEQQNFGITDQVPNSNASFEDKFKFMMSRINEKSKADFKQNLEKELDLERNKVVIDDEKEDLKSENETLKLEKNELEKKNLLLQNNLMEKQRTVIFFEQEAINSKTKFEEIQKTLEKTKKRLEKYSQVYGTTEQNVLTNFQQESLKTQIDQLKNDKFYFENLKFYDKLDDAAKISFFKKYSEFMIREMSTALNHLEKNDPKLYEKLLKKHGDKLHYEMAIKVLLSPLIQRLISNNLKNKYSHNYIQGHFNADFIIESINFMILHEVNSIESFDKWDKIEIDKWNREIENPDRNSLSILLQKYYQEQVVGGESSFNESSVTKAIALGIISPSLLDISATSFLFKNSKGEIMNVV